MKIFRRILNRYSWKRVLLFYLLVGIALYVLDKLCMLTIPLNQRHLSLLERPVGCLGFEVVIFLIRAFLYFPSTYLLPALLFWLDGIIGTPLTQNELVMFLSPVVANAFLLFLLGSGINYLRNRNKVAEK